MFDWFTRPTLENAQKQYFIAVSKAANAQYSGCSIQYKKPIKTSRYGDISDIIDSHVNTTKNIYEQINACHQKRRNLFQGGGKKSPAKKSRKSPAKKTGKSPKKSTKRSPKRR